MNDEKDETIPTGLLGITRCDYTVWPLYKIGLKADALPGVPHSLRIRMKND